MKTISRRIDVKVEPEELARLFAHLDSDDQIKFFNELANEIDLTYKVDFGFQLAYVSSGNIPLTKRAKEIMIQIGEYGK